MVVLSVVCVNHGREGLRQPSQVHVVEVALSNLCFGWPRGRYDAAAAAAGPGGGAPCALRRAGRCGYGVAKRARLVGAAAALRITRPSMQVGSSDAALTWLPRSQLSTFSPLYSLSQSLNS
jgi:hypothetical protein